MRKYLLLVVLLATSNAFAWSLDTRISSKPVCDRIDPAPAKSVAPIHEDAPAPNGGNGTGSNTTATVIVPPVRAGGSGFGRARNAPRWQSFLPGMFK